MTTIRDEEHKAIADRIRPFIAAVMGSDPALLEPTLGFIGRELPIVLEDNVTSAFTVELELDTYKLTVRDLPGQGEEWLVDNGMQVVGSVRLMSNGNTVVILGQGPKATILRNTPTPPLRSTMAKETELRGAVTLIDLIVRLKGGHLATVGMFDDSRIDGLLAEASDLVDRLCEIAGMMDPTQVLRDWMKANRLTFEEYGERVGLSGFSVGKVVKTQEHTYGGVSASGMRVGTFLKAYCGTDIHNPSALAVLAALHQIADQ